MKKEQEEIFRKLAKQYSESIHLVNNFIIVNELDYDEVWNLANQHYDEEYLNEKPTSVSGGISINDFR